MKKLLVLLCTLIAVTTSYSADVANLTIESGYNNSYTVNGVEVASKVPYAGIGAVKSLKYADVYVGGLLIADGNTDQTHWLLGAGKTLTLMEQTGISLRVDASVLRHQTASVGIENSTELGAKLALQNPWLTPFVRGVVNLELEQNGYFVGAERVQPLPLGFAITPSGEWGRMSDYDAWNAKATLTRPVAFTWGTVTPFAEIGVYDNSNWSAIAPKLALKQFNNDVVYNVGLKVDF